MVMARAISTAFYEDFHPQLKHEVMKYWINYNYDIIIGKTKINNESFIYNDF